MCAMEHKFSGESLYCAAAVAEEEARQKMREMVDIRDKVGIQQRDKDTVRQWHLYYIICMSESGKSDLKYEAFLFLR